jgi:hypothetical protein
MAQELLHYQPTNGGHDGWLARIAELVIVTGENPTQGARTGAGVPDQSAGASRAESSPRSEPSCHIVHRALEDAYFYPLSIFIKLLAKLYISDHYCI